MTEEPEILDVFKNPKNILSPSTVSRIGDEFFSSPIFPYLNRKGDIVILNEGIHQVEQVFARANLALMMSDLTPEDVVKIDLVLFSDENTEKIIPICDQHFKGVIREISFSSDIPFKSYVQLSFKAQKREEKK